MRSIDGAAAPASFLATKIVLRRLVNATDLADWARTEGFSDLRPSAWHVTVIWRDGDGGLALDATDLRVEADSLRQVARMGGVIALRFGSTPMEARHAAHRAAGGLWPFAVYRPHVSFTPDDGRDLRGVRPFEGALLLGPEVLGRDTT